MHKETCTGDIPDAWRLHGTGLKKHSLMTASKRGYRQTDTKS
ncbi:hypothetical protein [Pseudomonas gingeri]|nr:hypothetical protein [Pseudomonas gingeri]